MNIEINNLAKIKKSDIRLDGITVIAGENNTGKSTVGKVIDAFFHSLYNYPDNIIRQRVNGIRARIAQTIPTFHLRLTRKDKNLENLVYEYRRNIKNGTITPIIHYIAETYDLKPENVQKEDPTFFEDIENALSISDETILKRIVSANFSRAFGGQVNNINNDSSASISVEIKGAATSFAFQNNVCTDITEPKLLLNTSTIFDDCDYLDQYADRLKRDYVNSHIKENDNSEIDSVVSEIIADEKLNEIYEIMDREHIGVIRNQGNGNFSYSSDNLSKPLSISNLSSGLKSFVLLKTLISKNEIKTKDILIFDEPEIHLHPEWQVLYAQILILLQKAFDLTVIITSHSPYFIDAVNLYAAKYDSLKKCNFYLSEENNNEVTFKNVNDNIDDIYKKLANPIDLLDTLRYELQEEGKLC